MDNIQSPEIAGRVRVVFVMSIKDPEKVSVKYRA